jgi:hypothetical protein
MDNLRRKLNDNVSKSFLDQSLKTLKSKIYQSVSKYIKALNFREKKMKGKANLILLLSKEIESLPQKSK